MATGKGIAAVITAAAAVTAGGIYLGTSGQTDTGPPPPVTEETEAFPEPGAYAMRPSGQLIALRETTSDEMNQLWERHSAGEDLPTLIQEMNVPVIPRVRRLMIVAPDLEWSWDETIQGGLIRLADMSSPDVNFSAEELESGSGAYGVVLDRVPEGDLISVGWIHVSEGPQRMWLALLEGEGPAASPIPDREGVFAVGADGQLIELAEFTFEAMERLESRMQAGEDVAALFAELDMPTVPRITHLVIRRPGTVWEDRDLESGVARRAYDMDQIVFEELSTPGLGEEWHEFPDFPGTWEVIFTEPVVGDILGIFWESRDRSEQAAWLARFGG
jgi:hypothetical protein